MGIHLIEFDLYRDVPVKKAQEIANILAAPSHIEPYGTSFAIRPVGLDKRHRRVYMSFEALSRLKNTEGFEL